MGTDTVVTRLAKFCCGLRFDNLDRVVVEKIKQLVIDQLASGGCLLSTPLEPKPKPTPFTLQAAFADINISKSRSVY